jgi:hypothetical protein
MPQAHKLRLGDGSVIELGPSELRSWYERGLINDDTLVQVPGSNTWTPLARAAGAREARGKGRRSPPVTRASLAAARGGARRSFPSPWPRRLALGGAGVAVLALVAFTSGWWLPALQGGIASLRGRSTPAARPAAGGTEDEVQRRHRLAVQEATTQLPHLSRDTIELVMSSSAAGVLEPSEVFRRAYEAAGRGLPSLQRAEAQELAALNSALSGALSARERVQLADYIERVRGRRPTSPAEDAEMAGLVRRGTAALAPPRRVRLQALFAKVVASALAAPPPAQPPVEGASAEETR